MLYCDGISCDDGTPADGVMTSSSCGCGEEITGACARVLIDLSANTSFDRSKDGGFRLTTQENGNFIGYLTDSTYYVHLCALSDFNVVNEQTWKIPVDSISQQLANKFYLVICKNGGNAGRRDFTIDYFPVEESENGFCEDGVDNDLDGLIDCDDPDCHKYCDYSSTKSSAEGGLESHNDLGDKIANVRYNAKASQLYNSPLWKEPIRSSARYFDTPMANDLNAFTNLSSFKEAKAVESSPLYLTDITNATALKAWDFIVSQRRVAGVLAIYSEKGVYEHAKTMCDRLSGAKILDILKWSIDDRHNFLITKFQSANGSVEYAMTFSVSKDDDGNMSLESFWNLSSYSSERSHYTIQLWANSTYYLSQLFQTIKSNIEELYPIVSYDIGNAPGIFINKVKLLNNGSLQLHYTNKSNLDKATFTGSISPTEQSAAKVYEYVHSLSDRIVDSIVLPSDLFYDIGITVKGDEVEDAIFFADGRWEVSYDQSVDKLNLFNVDPGLASIGEGYVVRRSVSIDGTVKNYINLYRSLKADFTVENLDNYNVLSFHASGKGYLEIAVVRESEDNWNKQGKFYINLQPEDKKYVISRNELIDSDGDISSWNDPYMIVFTIVGNGYTHEDFELSLSEVQFSDYSIGKNILVRNSDSEILTKKNIEYKVPAKFEGQWLPIELIFENLSLDTIDFQSVSSSIYDIRIDRDSSVLINILPHSTHPMSFWVPSAMLPGEFIIPVTITTSDSDVIELAVNLSVECVQHQNILHIEPSKAYRTYKAIESISSIAMIDEGSFSFKAGDSVTLMPGFEVQNSAVLSLEIVEDCAIER